MDVQTLDEEIYMSQPKGFIEKGRRLGQSSIYIRRLFLSQWRTRVMGITDAADSGDIFDGGRIHGGCRRREGRKIAMIFAFLPPSSPIPKELFVFNAIQFTTGEQSISKFDITFHAKRLRSELSVFYIVLEVRKLLISLPRPYIDPRLRFTDSLQALFGYIFRSLHQKPQCVIQVSAKIS